jgi:hypothetical protein
MFAGFQPGDGRLVRAEDAGQGGLRQAVLDPVADHPHGDRVSQGSPLVLSADVGVGQFLRGGKRTPREEIRDKIIPLDLASRVSR